MHDTFLGTDERQHFRIGMQGYMIEAFVPVSDRPPEGVFAALVCVRPCGMLGGGRRYGRVGGRSGPDPRLITYLAPALFISLVDLAELAEK